MLFDPEWIEYMQAPPEVRALALVVHGTQASRETFRLPDLWALHFYEYSGEIEVDGERFELYPGVVTLVPPGATVTYHYRGISRHLYCHFSTQEALPREALAPVFLHANPLLDALKQGLGEASGFRHQEPLRARARLWDVLLGIAWVQRLGPKRKEQLSLMMRATEIAQQEMDSAISIAALARRLSVSHNQFIQVVRQQTGRTPRDWLNRMRMDRAEELLKFSDLDIKAIACLVGYPDLQHFNKTIRRHFDCSPRALRRKVKR